jgi:transcriptional regulator with XRE-family HTH domain
MLERLRTSKGITCTFVAKQLKIDRSTLRRIEKGETALPAEFIPFLSSLYGVTYKEIIEGRVRDEQNNFGLSEGLRKA